MIEYRAVCWTGEILRVTDLFDQRGQPTIELDRAVSCVIHYANACWDAFLIDNDFHVYTVH